MMAATISRSPELAEVSEMEASTKSALDQKLARRSGPPYRLVDTNVLEQRLRNFIQQQEPRADVSNVFRITGGASKEQFVFTVENGEQLSGRYILRMDALGSLIEIDRRREFQAMSALAPVIPVPKVIWSDPEGAEFGQPACIMSFCPGVTKPTAGLAGGDVTGLGTVLGEAWRTKLSQQFIDNLVAVHGFDWRRANLPAFGAPSLADPYQVARWQVNWWTRVWREDNGVPVATMALAERWLRANLPACEDPVFLHGDYRTGNFLFDDESGKINATLDWELSHIGDFHEDLAWLLQTSLGSYDGDQFYYGGLITFDDWLNRYEAASSRKVDRKTLRFYRVLSTYKSICIAFGTSLAVSNSGHTHQDVLLTWIAAYGHIGHSEICDLLQESVSQ